MALNGRLLVVGGESPQVPGVLDVVECFDPTLGAWQRLAPMPTPRSSPTLLSQEGLLYVLGGLGDVYGDDADLLCPSCSAEVFDIVAQSWTKLSSIPEPVSGCRARHLPPLILET